MRYLAEVTKINFKFPDLTRILKKNKAQVQKRGSERLVLNRSQHQIQKKDIPYQAIKVLEGLQRAGFQAYLVGGCIRDLLSGKAPKDFDVSTNATPEQVRKVFKNSRIIGRRFKIVHVVFGREIIEVTTFRSNKEPKHDSTRHLASDSGMLVRDNVYGKTLEEDAERRDFTINAIYFDLKKSELIDYHAGLYDLQDHVIDIIGDPETRYSEDPVRIIRALRFAAKLGFKLSKRTADPITKMAPALTQVSNARMFEEVNKLFLTGHGLQSFRILKEYGIFNILFPGLEDYLENPVFNSFVEFALKSSDDRCAQNKRNMPHFLYAVILWAKFQNEILRLSDLNDSVVNAASMRELADLACPKILRTQNTITAIPISISESIRSMWSLQLQLLDINDPNNVASVASRQLFRGGFDIFRLRARFEPYLEPYVKFWQPYYDESAAKSKQRILERQARERVDDFYEDGAQAINSQNPYQNSPGFRNEQDLANSAQNSDDTRAARRKRRREQDELRAQADEIFKSLTKKPSQSDSANNEESSSAINPWGNDHKSGNRQNYNEQAPINPSSKQDPAFSKDDIKDQNNSSATNYASASINSNEHDTNALKTKGKTATNQDTYEQSTATNNAKQANAQEKEHSNKQDLEDAERLDRLARARAWRASMNLEP